MENIDCLLVFEDQALSSNLSKGLNKAQLIELMRKKFSNRKINIVQLWNKNWEAWVNIEDSFSLEDRCKIRGISIKSCGNLDPETSVVFCCDMQERFRPAIKFFSEISQVAARIIQGSKLLQIPLIVTEQYPKGLGKTVEEIDISHAELVSEKTKFSMLTLEVKKFLEDHHKIESVILFGVETHVCVQQTSHDLMSLGYDVHIIADATSSRTGQDRHLGFQRLLQLGAFVTTCETVLLQFIAEKDHKDFKQIQKLIKETPSDTGLNMLGNI